MPPTPASNPYLTFSSPEPFSISTTNESKSWDGTLEYSTDAENWAEWDGTEVNSSDEGKLYFRGSNNTVISSYSNETNSWSLDGDEISCIGNIETLLDYQTVMNGEHPQMGVGCYSGMFQYSSSLITAPELLATTLTEGCYKEMFLDCGSLTMVPDLSATILAESCCNNMFQGCTSLTKAPKLPATTLAQDCYNSMFNGCTSIKLSETQDTDYTTPYRIPTTGTGTEVTDALADMFTSTGGTFTGTPTINTTYYLHKDNHIV